MRNVWVIAFLLTGMQVVGVSFARADVGGLAECSASTAVGQTCLISIRSMHPTEFALGYREVADKVAALKKKSPSEVSGEIKKKPAPCVVGPGGIYFMVDHHHFAVALEQVGVDTMRATVSANLSGLGEAQFYSQMLSHGWFWLYDQNGAGPVDPRGIPSSLLQLPDDPYRSLAGAVRDAGGYTDTAILFADFYWADFFRSRIQIAPGDTGFAQAVSQAVTLAGSPQAQGLPGYHTLR